MKHDWQTVIHSRAMQDFLGIECARCGLFVADDEIAEFLKKDRRANRCTPKSSQQDIKDKKGKTNK